MFTNTIKKNNKNICNFFQTSTIGCPGDLSPLH